MQRNSDPCKPPDIYCIHKHPQMSKPALTSSLVYVVIRTKSRPKKKEKGNSAECKNLCLTQDILSIKVYKYVWVLGSLLPR